MTRRSRTDDDEPRAQSRGTAARVIRVGNYIVERRLGSGGQADVFLARDVVLRRLVALKVLHRTTTGHHVRGLEEARLIATLDHPNIVRVHHVELAEGVWYMAMEYVDGGNLELRVGRVGPLEPERALRYSLVVSDALQHAHKIGVVHRDVKPQNLLETRAGVIKLADFGLAGLRRDALESTAPVRLVGTPQYLAPEMWLGEAATAKADMYGLGATLYFMLTGHPPFDAKTARDLRTAHLSQPVVFPPGVPRPAIAVVQRMMAKNPDDRPASASALYEEIQGALVAFTGDRRRAPGGPRQPGQPARRATDAPGATEPGVGLALTHQNRSAADAAVLDLPVFRSTRARLEEVLQIAPPILIFHGPVADALKAVVRNVIDLGARRFYVAARAVLTPATPTLAGRLLEQLHLGPGPVPAWHDRVCAELQPEAGASPTLPSVMELDVRRPLGPAEATDLIELGRRAEGKNITFLVTCDAVTAQGLLAELQTSGFAFLVRHVAMPRLSEDERAEQVRTWTARATADRIRWTDDALRLLRHTENLKKTPAALLMHNAIMIAARAGMRLCTSWSVLAAEEHHNYIQNAADVVGDWQARPPRWPTDELLPVLRQLRERATGPHLALPLPAPPDEAG